MRTVDRRFKTRKFPTRDIEAVVRDNQTGEEARVYLTENAGVSPLFGLMEHNDECDCNRGSWFGHDGCPCDGGRFSVTMAGPMGGPIMFAGDDRTGLDLFLGREIHLWVVSDLLNKGAA